MVRELIQCKPVSVPYDISHISLALQGYNFGNGYIDWAVEHFGGYTRANAKIFSDDMKQKLGVSVYGDPDHVGIVEKIENRKVYTIEGNRKDECKEKLLN